MNALRRADPMLPLTALVATVVYLLHGFDGSLSRDPASFAYGGQRVADGVPPYVGLLTRVGPLAHLLPGIGVAAARVIGTDDLLGARVLFMLISVVCVAVAYLLGRELFGSRLAGVASAAALLCFHGFIHYATYGPREKTAVVLFVLLALLALLHQRWGTSGFLTALATLTWQPIFPALIVGAVVAVHLGLGAGRTRALARLAVGGLVPTAVTVGTYAAAGALDVFLDDFVLINTHYTKQISPLSMLSRTADKMTAGFGWSLAVVVVGAVALLALAGVALARPGERRDPRRAALAGSAAVLVVGMLWTARSYDGWPDLLPFLPCAALGVGGTVAAVSRRVTGRTATAVATAWAVTATAMAVTYSVDRQTVLERQRAGVAAVLDLLPPDATMLSVQAPQPLVLSGKPNLSRHQIFSKGLSDYVDDVWPGGMEGYGRWVGAQEPTLISVGLSPPPTWLAPVIDASYSRIGRVPGWSWYVRKDVGRENVEALRAAIRGVA